MPILGRSELQRQLRCSYRNSHTACCMSVCPCNSTSPTSISTAADGTLEKLARLHRAWHRVEMPYDNPVAATSPAQAVSSSVSAINHATDVTRAEADRRCPGACKRAERTKYRKHRNKPTIHTRTSPIQFGQASLGSGHPTPRQNWCANAPAHTC